MLIIFWILLSSILYSVDITNDSLAIIVDEKTDLILNEVQYIDPLNDKVFGIEINPLYTMFFDDGFNLSGTISNFSLSNFAEIAFPFKYSTVKENNKTQSSLFIDAQYRYFLGKHRNGKYIMTGVRIYFGEDSKGNYEKGGISFGIGERVFGQRGWYWGSSVYLGKYYFGDKDRESESFYNAEFLKFGFIF